MKSSKLLRVVWIVGIYAVLALILYLVVLYKVEWEHKDLNTYMYLYDCSRQLCTSTNIQDDYYSKILCEEDICPYIYDINGDNLLLKRENKIWLYNYVQDEIIDDKYIDYRYIGNDMYVVSDGIGNYGVIDSLGKVLVELKYNYIDDYKNGFVSYIKNDLYGIVSIDESYKIEPIYEDVVLINNKIFAGMEDNLYYLHSYNDINNNNANNYDYVYAYNDVILTISNKKIDILDSNLNSKLLMKINTFYEYKIEKERDSLEIYSDGEYIYFKVFVNESEYTNYKYNIKDSKLV